MSEPLDLDAIEARADAATAGPWSVYDRGVGFMIALDDGVGDRVLPEGGRTDIGYRDDAEFIAHSRSDVPALVARVRELEAEIVRRKVINTLSRMKADIDPDDPTAIEAWRETTIGWKERCELAEAKSARVRELTPRVIEGDWEAVRDTLEALPDGAQIRWRTGMNPRPELAIHRAYRWHCTDGSLPRTSHNIARDNTPIEVIG